MEVESVAGSSRLPPSTPVKATIRAHSYPTPESIPRVARLVSRWLPFKLLPSFARHSTDVDIPESPTQYCDVGTATSPIAVEEDIDMVPPHVNVASPSLSVPSHQSASSSSDDVNMDDNARTSPRCAGCQRAQADALEIELLKEKVKEITEEMTKIKEERDTLAAKLEESEESVSSVCRLLMTYSTLFIDTVPRRQDRDIEDWIVTKARRDPAASKE
ncbi:hypothetical protein EV421DRAFT_227888 [Armillaria borealis]|uniref:Uncharacterized protein n=1 Tax=Armillaria borealis TaxID=47425 RepID=A0AA39JQE1_9AGAR|nr:hypothetical protein EV421DRAFT_227888 [Armillaria borealis]